MSELLDCLVVGGGPGGLTAAIYLARYHLTLRVIDAGDSRAEWIPLSHNHAGYPEGISGHELVRRMREQAAIYGAVTESGTVEHLMRGEDRVFRARTTLGEVTARTVLLATGVHNREPPMDRQAHDEGLRRGLIRYCPVCDGYEATDKRIAVYGHGARGAREALFLRAYSRDVTLVDPEPDPGLGEEDARELAEAGVRVVPGPAPRVWLGEAAVMVDTPGGPLAFDTLYPALGSEIRADLARGLGARLAGDRCVEVDDHSRTGVTGLYAAGDVVKGLDQISHAMGQAAVAATAIRNDLAEERPLWR